MVKIDLTVIGRKITPWPEHRIIRPALNHLSLAFQPIQMRLICKIILHAILFPVPDRPGGIHPHRAVFRQPAHQLLINCILARGTFAHNVKYISHF